MRQIKVGSMTGGGGVGETDQGREYDGGGEGWDETDQGREYDGRGWK